MENIIITAVSNGYILKSTISDLYGELHEEVSVHRTDDELKTKLGDLLFKALVNQMYNDCDTMKLIIK